MKKYKTLILLFTLAIIILNIVFYSLNGSVNKDEKESLMLSYKIGYFDGANAVIETLNDGVNWDYDIAELRFMLDSMNFSDRVYKDR